MGTSTAASSPRLVTTCGPSLKQAFRNSLKRAFASCTGQLSIQTTQITSHLTSLTERAVPCNLANSAPQKLGCTLHSTLLCQLVSAFLGFIIVHSNCIFCQKKRFLKNLATSFTSSAILSVSSSPMVPRKMVPAASTVFAPMATAPHCHVVGSLGLMPSMAV